MKLIEFALVLSGVLLNAAAQLLLKAGTRTIGHFDFSIANALPISLKFLANPAFMGGMACYGISVIVWVMALSRVDVSIAYPMLSIGYIVTAFLAYMLFGEAITPMRILGIVVIIIGVALVARS